MREFCAGHALGDVGYVDLLGEGEVGDLPAGGLGFHGCNIRCLRL